MKQIGECSGVFWGGGGGGRKEWGRGGGLIPTTQLVLVLGFHSRCYPTKRKLRIGDRRRVQILRDS